MKILLAHNSTYFPSHGGGDKSNRLLMEALAGKGHTVRVVSRVEQFGEEAHAALASQLAQRAVPFDENAESIRFTRNGVDVRTLTRSAQLRTYFAAQIESFDPDVIVTSTDDPAQLLFDLARRAVRARTVYLIRATIATPFGPDSSMLNAGKTAVLQEADGVVGVSEYVADYARRFGGLAQAIHVPISLMESNAAERVGSFENPFVTFVNPCAVKGIAIFLQLAERMPHVRFAAVPTWGTTEEEFARLRALPNITLLAPMDDISELLRQTRVMLVPSLWAEARSRMVMESMLRAIPVMASDVGGLKEAKLGVPYLLPVHPIRHYLPSLDANMVPVAEVPEQDATPWQVVLERLTANPEHWAAVSEASRAAALQYLETLTVEPFEHYLQSLLQKPKQIRAAPSEKQRLLAILRKQRSWFPKCGATPRVFCFPYAGAGALVYQGWALPPFAVCPVQLPGREERAPEPAFERMEDLVAALQKAIRPMMDEGCVFFGHSMGAGVAFELVRALRRAGQPLPRALAVSGAKPPQFRRHRTPPAEPTAAEFLADMARLGSAPSAWAFPVLQADARLYRNYTYQEEAALSIPIFAYSGDADPNVTPAQMAEWSQQSSGLFHQTVFEGGHFYLKERQSELLAALTRDLASL